MHKYSSNVRPLADQHGKRNDDAVKTNEKTAAVYYEHPLYKLHLVTTLFLTQACKLFLEMYPYNGFKLVFLKILNQRKRLFLFNEQFSWAASNSDPRSMKQRVKRAQSRGWVRNPSDTTFYREKTGLIALHLNGSKYYNHIQARDIFHQRCWNHSHVPISSF